MVQCQARLDFPFEVKPNCLAEILQGFVHGCALAHDWEFEAFGDVEAFALDHDCMDQIANRGAALPLGAFHRRRWFLDGPVLFADAVQASTGALEMRPAMGVVLRRIDTASAGNVRPHGLPCGPNAARVGNRAHDRRTKCLWGGLAVTVPSTTKNL